MISLTHFENFEINTGPTKPPFDSDGVGDGFSTIFAGFIPLMPVTLPPRSINESDGGSAGQRQESSMFQAGGLAKQPEIPATDFAKPTAESDYTLAGMTTAVTDGGQLIIPEVGDPVVSSGVSDPAAPIKSPENIPVAYQPKLSGTFTQDVVLNIEEQMPNVGLPADQGLLIQLPDRQYVPKPLIPAKFEDIEVHPWELPANEQPSTEPAIIGKVQPTKIEIEKTEIKAAEVREEEIDTAGLKPTSINKVDVEDIGGKMADQVPVYIDSQADQARRLPDAFVNPIASEDSLQIPNEIPKPGPESPVKMILPEEPNPEFPFIDFAVNAMGDDGEVTILQDIPPGDEFIDFDTTPILDPIETPENVPDLAMNTGLFDAKIQELMKRNVPPLGPDGFIAMTNPEFAKRYSQTSQLEFSPIKAELKTGSGSESQVDTQIYPIPEMSVSQSGHKKPLSALINNITGLIRSESTSPNETSEPGLYEPNSDSPPIILPGDLKPRQNGSPYRALQPTIEPGKPFPAPGQKMPAEKLRSENPRPFRSGGPLPAEQIALESGPAAFKDPLISLTTRAATGFEIVHPIADNTAEGGDDFTGVNFEKFLQSVSKEQGPVPINAENTAENIRIFKQIEKPVLELAAIVEKSDGNKTIKMRLNPDELGEVEIHIEHRSDGTIKAHIKTETESAQKILTSGLEHLRETLQNNGWRVESLEISSSPFASTGNQSREDGSRQNENVPRTDQMIPEMDDPIDNQETEDGSDRLVNLRA